MVATEVTSSKRRTPPAARAGTLDVDAAVVGALRAYVLAADEHQAAKKRMDDARAALDAAAGDSEMVTHAGATVFQFQQTARRTVDIDRLAERHPEVYADVATESTSYRLVVDPETRRLLRLRTWRAAVRRRTA
jgi:hypothetical protein